MGQRPLFSVAFLGREENKRSVEELAGIKRGNGCVFDEREFGVKGNLRGVKYVEGSEVGMIGQDVFEESG